MTELKYHPHIIIQTSSLSSLTEGVKIVIKLFCLTDPDQPHLGLHPHHLPMGPGFPFQVILQLEVSAVGIPIYSSTTAVTLPGHGSCCFGLSDQLWIYIFTVDLPKSHLTGFWPWQPSLDLILIWSCELTSQVDLRPTSAPGVSCWSGLLVEPSYQP